MNVYLSPSFSRSYKKLTRKSPWLASKIKAKVGIFKKNPAHKSLRLHKLTGPKQDVWSFSIEEDIRVIFYRTKKDVVFTDIGKHEEVY